MQETTIFKEILYKKCWRAWDGILPAIFFELGEKKDDRTGIYSLCLDFCPWQISKEEKIICNSKSNKEEILSSLKLFEEKTITKIETNNKDQLIFTFENIVLHTYLNSSKDNFYILTPQGEVSFSKKTLIKIEK